MMRQAVVTFFAGIYLVLSIGPVVNVHYCMGHLQSVQLLVEADPCCCAKYMPVGCCENHSLKLDADAGPELGSSFQLSIPGNEVSDLITISQPDLLADFRVERQIITRGPPPPKAPLPVLNCALIFYG